ncbi:Beta-barrel assembly machine subunit BamE [Shimia gijangensis]|uniref:Beta-barrel assembly machine subunit BamE n=1 Tax=Shimia gijangensis TaxID=1470563 RepID=A0A1M6E4L3_9RHOB|nr:outer membrane protein assembly factor BamE [Shimia gijangensis]SHI80427.1 Beta-barrel assembly machine subunit BamE [Shimia gijangensis]
MTAGTKRMKTAMLGACLLLVMACTTQYRNHGYVPLPEDLEKIKIGADNRNSVAEAVGTPSASGVLDDSGYYYVRTRVKHYGARKPQVVERRLVAITFDSRGTVRNVAEYSLEDGKAVPLTRRVTDNGIENQNLLKQLTKNIGGFTPAF